MCDFVLVWLDLWCMGVGFVSCMIFRWVGSLRCWFILDICCSIRCVEFVGCISERFFDLCSVFMLVMVDGEDGGGSGDVFSIV